MSGQYIHKNVIDIRDGDAISAIYKVIQVERRKRPDKPDYLSMVLGDASGRIQAISWSPEWNVVDALAPGSFVGVVAEASLYKGMINIKVTQMGAMSAPSDTSLWDEPAKVNVSKLSEEFTAAAESIVNPSLRSIVMKSLEDRVVWLDFLACPAGVKLHGAFRGGLIDHTLKVYRNATALAKTYIKLDLDLIKAAALVHDIGKVRQYQWVGDEIRAHPVYGMTGHIVEGIRMVEAACMQIDPNRADKTLWAWCDHLVHLIASHHGRLEHGSPCVPQCPEAMILHYADCAECYVSSYYEIAEDPTVIGPSKWSTVHGSKVYCGPMPWRSE